MVVRAPYTFQVIFLIDRKKKITSYSSTNIKTPFPAGMPRVLQLSFFFVILFFTGQTKKRTSTLNESIPETTGSHAILNSFS